MKKFIPILLFAIVAVYSFFWWRQSTLVKNNIIAAAKKNGVEYESLCMKGYPFQLIVEATNVRARGHEFLGTVSLGVDFLARNPWINLSGEYRGKTCIKGNHNIRLGHFSLQNHIEGKDCLEDWIRDATIASDHVAFFENDRIIAEIEKSMICIKTKEQAGEMRAFLELDLDNIRAQSFFVKSAPENISQLHTVVEAGFPMDWKDGNYLPISIEVSELESSDLYSDSKLSGKFNFDLATGGRFVLNTIQKFKRPYPGVDQEKFFEQMDPLFTQYPLFGVMLKNHWDRFLTIVPNPSNMGSLKMDIDIEVGGDFQNFVFHQLNYATDFYGIEISGNTTTVPETTEILIRLDRHRDLIKDLSQYYNQIRPILNDFGLNFLLPLPESAPEKIALFLESFSQTTSETEVRFAIHIKENQSVMIGTQPIEQIQMSFSSLVADLFSEVQIEPGAKDVLMSPVPL